MSIHSDANTQVRPAVSVGMPVFNSAAWIASAIESILGQSFGDLELVISDNASTDRTYLICEHYARMDARIHLHRNSENIGANRNYLSVLTLARAPYFKWASSNDICAPTFIERCVDALQRDPSAVLACSKASLFEDEISDAKPYERDLSLLSEEGCDRFMALLNTIGLNNAFNGVIRKEALRRVVPMGNFQKADVVVMAELALLGKFLLIEERLFLRRMSENSATRFKSPREVDRHLAPHAVSPLRWQNWLFYLALMRAAWRQWRHVNHSMTAVLYVLRQMRWARGDLVRDIRQAIGQSGW